MQLEQEILQYLDRIRDSEGVKEGVQNFEAYLDGEHQRRGGDKSASVSDNSVSTAKEGKSAGKGRSTSTAVTGGLTSPADGKDANVGPDGPSTSNGSLRDDGSAGAPKILPIKGLLLATPSYCDAFIYDRKCEVAGI